MNLAKYIPQKNTKFYYEHLNDLEKKIYNQIYDAIMAFEEKILLTDIVHSETVMKIFRCVSRDHSYIFWLANPGYSILQNTQSVAKEIQMQYVLSPEEVSSRMEEITIALAPFYENIKSSMRDDEIALKVYENIIDLIHYDSLGLAEQKLDKDHINKPDDLRSIYGVFVNKKAVCAGYSKAFQYLTNCFGIECTYVAGNCPPTSKDTHAWNLIKLQNKYYYVDCTWGDRSSNDSKKDSSLNITYNYFCLTTEEIQKSRTIEQLVEMPVCTAKACNYHQKNGLYFAIDHVYRIKPTIANALKNREPQISLKFANQELYRFFKNVLIDAKDFWDIVHKEQISLKEYQYTIHDKLYIINFFPIYKNSI